MKKTFSIIIVSLLFSVLLLQIITPTVAFGACPAGNSSGFVNNGISNPLCVNSVQDIIKIALQFVVNLLAVAGVVYIIWTGFMFVKAQGKPEELSKAKTAFFHAIIGMAIILGAWAIATALANTINQVTGTNDAVLGTNK